MARVTIKRGANRLCGFMAAAIALSSPNHAAADLPPPAPPPSYADIADLADSAPLVVKVQVHESIAVEPARAGNVREGWARLYIEADTLGVISGAAPVGRPLAGEVRFLIDVPLDARGKPPSLKKAVMLVFARAVPGDPAQLQLVFADGALPWDPATEARARGIMADMAAPGAPGRITAVRELSYVPGALVGEGETQIFIATADGEPASISVEHKPGMATRWSASFSDVTDPSGLPPARDTLAWYRLACFLPAAPPAIANISDTEAAKRQAADDYAMVRAALGACPRTRR